jgi:tetratricopeptide (TPR) repeat protein
MPMFRLILIVSAVVAGGIAGVMAPQPGLPIPNIDISTSQKMSDAQKRLFEIMGERDAEVRATQLEQFIRGNPDPSSLSRAYSSLLSLWMSSKPEKAITLADEAFARFPDPMASIRETAYVAKLNALRAQKNEGAIGELGQKVLEIETNPRLLYTIAQQGIKNSLNMLEKAIAERAKKSGSTAGQPSMMELRWQYGLSIARTGRMDEGFRLCSQVLDANEKEIANMETLAANDAGRRGLDGAHWMLSGKYWTISDLFKKAGQFDKALEFLRLSEPHLGGNRTELRAWVEQLRAGIYAKIGKPDLELESYMNSFAVRHVGIPTHYFIS